MPDKILTCVRCGFTSDTAVSGYKDEPVYCTSRRDCRYRQNPPERGPYECRRCKYSTRDIRELTDSRGYEQCLDYDACTSRYQERLHQNSLRHDIGGRDLYTEMREWEASEEARKEYTKEYEWAEYKKKYFWSDPA